MSKPLDAGPQKTMPKRFSWMLLLIKIRMPTWRPSHEDSLGQLSPQPRELVWVPQVLNNLFQLSLSLRAPLHVAEGADGLFRQHLLQEETDIAQITAGEE